MAQLASKVWGGVSGIFSKSQAANLAAIGAGAAGLFGGLGIPTALGVAAATSGGLEFIKKTWSGVTDTRIGRQLSRNVELGKLLPFSPTRNQAHLVPTSVPVSKPRDFSRPISPVAKEIQLAKLKIDQQTVMYGTQNLETARKGVQDRRPESEAENLQRELALLNLKLMGTDFEMDTPVMRELRDAYQSWLVRWEKLRTKPNTVESLLLKYSVVFLIFDFILSYEPAPPAPGTGGQADTDPQLRRLQDPFLDIWFDRLNVSGAIEKSPTQKRQAARARNILPYAGKVPTDIRDLIGGFADVKVDGIQLTALKLTEMIKRIFGLYYIIARPRKYTSVHEKGWTEIIKETFGGLFSENEATRITQANAAIPDEVKKLRVLLGDSSVLNSRTMRRFPALSWSTMMLPIRTTTQIPPSTGKMADLIRLGLKPAKDEVNSAALLVHNQSPELAQYQKTQDALADVPELLALTITIDSTFVGLTTGERIRRSVNELTAATNTYGREVSALEANSEQRKMEPASFGAAQRLRDWIRDTWLPLVAKWQQGAVTVDELQFANLDVKQVLDEFDKLLDDGDERKLQAACHRQDIQRSYVIAKRLVKNGPKSTAEEDPKVADQLEQARELIQTIELNCSNLANDPTILREIEITEEEAVRALARIQQNLIQQIELGEESLLRPLDDHTIQDLVLIERTLPPKDERRLLVYDLLIRSQPRRAAEWQFRKVQFLADQGRGWSALKEFGRLALFPESPPKVDFATLDLDMYQLYGKLMMQYGQDEIVARQISLVMDSWRHPQALEQFMIDHRLLARPESRVAALRSSRKEEAESEGIKISQAQFFQQSKKDDDNDDGGVDFGGPDVALKETVMQRVRTEIDTVANLLRAQYGQKEYVDTRLALPLTADQLEKILFEMRTYGAQLRQQARVKIIGGRIQTNFATLGRLSADEKVRRSKWMRQLRQFIWRGPPPANLTEEALLDRSRLSNKAAEAMAELVTGLLPESDETIRTDEWQELVDYYTRQLGEEEQAWLDQIELKFGLDEEALSSPDRRAVAEEKQRSDARKLTPSRRVDLVQFNFQLGYFSQFFNRPQGIRHYYERGVNEGIALAFEYQPGRAVLRSEDVRRLYDMLLEMLQSLIVIDQRGNRMVTTVGWVNSLYRIGQAPVARTAALPQEYRTKIDQLFRQFGAAVSEWMQKEMYTLTYRSVRESEWNLLVEQLLPLVIRQPNWKNTVTTQGVLNHEEVRALVLLGDIMTAVSRMPFLNRTSLGVTASASNEWTRLEPLLREAVANPLIGTPYPFFLYVDYQVHLAGQTNAASLSRQQQQQWARIFDGLAVGIRQKYPRPSLLPAEASVTQDLRLMFSVLSMQQPTWVDFQRKEVKLTPGQIQSWRNKMRVLIDFLLTLDSNNLLAWRILFYSTTTMPEIWQLPPPSVAIGSDSSTTTTATTVQTGRQQSAAVFEAVAIENFALRVRNAERLTGFARSIRLQTLEYLARLYQKQFRYDQAYDVFDDMIRLAGWAPSVAERTEQETQEQRQQVGINVEKGRVALPVRYVVEWLRAMIASTKTALKYEEYRPVFERLLDRPSDWVLLGPPEQAEDGLMMAEVYLLLGAEREADTQLNQLGDRTTTSDEVRRRVSELRVRFGLDRVQRLCFQPHSLAVPLPPPESPAISHYVYRSFEDRRLCGRLVLLISSDTPGSLMDSGFNLPNFFRIYFGPILERNLLLQLAGTPHGSGVRTAIATEASLLAIRSEVVRITVWQVYLEALKFFAQALPALFTDMRGHRDELSMAGLILPADPDQPTYAFQLGYGRVLGLSSGGNAISEALTKQNWTSLPVVANLPPQRTPNPNLLTIPLGSRTREIIERWAKQPTAVPSLQNDSFTWSRFTISSPPDNERTLLYLTNSHLIDFLQRNLDPLINRLGLAGQSWRWGPNLLFPDGKVSERWNEISFISPCGSIAQMIDAALVDLPDRLDNQAKGILSTTGTTDIRQTVGLRTSSLERDRILQQFRREFTQAARADTLVTESQRLGGIDMFERSGMQRAQEFASASGFSQAPSRPGSLLLGHDVSDTIDPDVALQYVAIMLRTVPKVPTPSSPVPSSTFGPPIPATARPSQILPPLSPPVSFTASQT